MSQINYANPQAQHPGLGPVTSSEAEREHAARNRNWAIVPVSISAWVNIFFLLTYWLPETSGFPNHLWWKDQLAPLSTTWLTSRGEAQVAAQEDSGLAPLVMLVASIGLVYLSRTHHWWGRIGILVPAAVGLLAGLGILIRLLTTGGNRTSALGVMLLVLWLIAAGYSASRGVQDRLGSPPPKTWHSGLPVLVWYAVMAPIPTAVGRWFFAPELRDTAANLQGNTVALRMSALVTPSTAWLYLSGLLVGVTIWVIYRWWPQRSGPQVTGLLIAAAVMLIILGGFGWQASFLADRRAAQLANNSPVAEDSFSCGAWTARPDPNAPALTVAVSGTGCRTITTFQGYRQVATSTLADASLSPIKARTPEGQPIVDEAVGAIYGPVLVVASTDRLDRAPTSLIGVRIVDATEIWTDPPCAEPLTLRFAGVDGGDKPDRGYITRDETEPQVVANCAGKTKRLDPQTGR